MVTSTVRRVGPCRAWSAILGALALTSAFAAPGCTCGAGETLAVDLRTNLVAGVEFDQARTDVWSLDDATLRATATTEVTRDTPVGEGARVGEFLRLEPGTYRVVVALTRAGALVSEGAEVALVRRATAVEILIARSCAGVRCGPDEVCVAGRCAGQGCARGACLPDTCTTDASCGTAEVACATALCLSGQCYPFPRAGACGAGRWCNPDVGCRVIPATPDHVDGSLDDPLDASVPCRPDTCDDGNPCTTDSCEGGACVSRSNRDVCDDGVYCNGADRCLNGECAEHAGDPCPGLSVCDAAAGRCVACATDADCPAPVYEAWSDCAFASACATEGSRVRGLVTSACVGGTCTLDSGTETDVCARPSRDGAPCAERRCDGWSACRWGGFCDERSERTRVCGDYVCAAGACVEVLLMEGETCVRSRDGRRCGANPSYCGQRSRCHLCEADSCVLNASAYDAECLPTCAEASRLCDRPGVCCDATVTCTPVGPGPFADCAQCCDAMTCPP